MRTYLRFAGWTQENSGPAGAMWVKDDRRIGLPAEPDEDLIAGAVRRLATAESLTQEDLSKKIQYLLFDVTHLRATGPQSDVDAIPLETGLKILSGARAMLRATATTARRERAQIGPNFSKLGDSVVRDSLIGHTIKGSYVIPVLIRLPEPELADLHQLPLSGSHEEVRVHRAPPEPFERRVVRTFAQSMRAVQELVVEPEREPRGDTIYELIYRGVSKEFCAALAGILQQKHLGEFEASVNWAAGLPAPSTMPSTVSIEAEAGDLIQRAANRLKQQKVDPNRIFSGTIVQLRHESPDDPFGEIAVSTVRNGHQAEILVRLRMEMYRDAWEWHFQNRAVLVEGTVRRAPGRPLRVDEPRRFHPVDEMDLLSPLSAEVAVMAAKQIKKAPPRELES